MSLSAEERIERALLRVVSLLVQEEYIGLERLTRGLRLRADEIESGVKEYGGTLVFPPAGAFSSADVVPIQGTSPQAYSVRFRLYTEEEGRSDLEVQATFTDTLDGDAMTVELDGILVA